MFYDRRWSVSKLCFGAISLKVQNGCSWSNFKPTVICPSLPGARMVVISRVARTTQQRRILTGFVQPRLNAALMIEAGKKCKCNVMRKKYGIDTTSKWMVKASASFTYECSRLLGYKVIRILSWPKAQDDACHHAYTAVTGRFTRTREQPLRVG